MKVTEEIKAREASAGNHFHAISKLMKGKAVHRNIKIKIFTANICMAVKTGHYPDIVNIS